MARTPNNTEITHFIADEVMDKNTAELSVAKTATELANALVEDKFETIKLIGRLEMSSFFCDIAEKVNAEMLVKIKKSKSYMGLPLRISTGSDLKKCDVANFEDFCNEYLPISYRRAMELISNYDQLGPDLYEQAEKIGFRQRDYNALKALPDDDKIIIVQALKEETPDKALELIQDMAAKHHREKEAAKKQLADAIRQLEDKDRVIRSKNEELNKKTEQISQLEIAKRNQAIDFAAEQEVEFPGEAQLITVQETARELMIEISARFNSEIIKLFQQFDGAPPKNIELAIAQAIGLIITSAYGVAENINIEPVTDPDTAADDRARADAKMMAGWQENGFPDIETFMSPETLANYRRLNALEAPKLDD